MYVFIPSAIDKTRYEVPQRIRQRDTERVNRRCSEDCTDEEYCDPNRSRRFVIHIGKLLELMIEHLSRFLVDDVSSLSVVVFNLRDLDWF